MPRASRDFDELESFSFSFLDILACTIGALAFILLMIVLSTQDLVERKPATEEDPAAQIPALEARLEVQEEELEVSRRRLEQLGSDQAHLEERNVELEAEVERLQAYEAEVEALARVKAELTEAVAAVQSELALARRESEEGELHVEELLARLDEEHRQRQELEAQLAPPESAAEVPIPDPDATDVPPEIPIEGPLVTEPGTEDPQHAAEVERPAPTEPLVKPSEFATAGESVEPQPPLLPNLERRIVTSADGGVRLGGAHAPVSIRDPKVLDQATRQFVRYFAPRQEVLWWSRLPESSAVHVAVLTAITSARMEWGRGLEAKAQRGQPQYDTVRGSSLALDDNGDGANDTFYLADPGVWAWTRRYVDAVPGLPGIEECYGDYDPRTARWRVKLVDTDGDGRYDLRLLDTSPTDSDWEVLEVDPYDAGQLIPLPGKARELLHVTPLPSVAALTAPDRAERPSCWIRYEDTDGDGLYDDKRVDTGPNPDSWGERWTGFDPEFKRWTQRDVDTDGDGAPDVRWRDTDPSDDSWEELWVRGDPGWELAAQPHLPDPTIVRWSARDATPTAGYFWRQISGYDAAGARVVRERFDDRDGDGRWDARSSDTDGDGKWDVLWVDTDGDGQWDRRQRGREGTRWLETLRDDDRDGRWDPIVR